MVEENQNKEIKKAVQIGSICIITYMASYVMRNILSVSSVQMMQDDNFTKDSIGMISSIYFLMYAIGQLINGRLGDKFRARTMVGIGLLVSGLSALAFPFLDYLPAQVLSFALNGFGLSMLRGPLVRTISENTLPKYARNCCTGFSVAGLCGPMVAGMLASILNWKNVFYVTSIFTVAMGVISYSFLTIAEKRGIINEKSVKETSDEKKSYLDVFRLRKFPMYMFVGAITEIVGASVAFWIPAYISEQLGFSAAKSSMLYSIMSLIKAMSPFVAVFIYNRIKERDTQLIIAMFFISCVMFALLNFVSNVWLCLIFLLLARMGSGCASTALWSIYIPGLRDTGCVSTANGVFDFSGYMAASIANMVFANAISQMGWSGLIYIWSGMMLAGVIAVWAFDYFDTRSNLKQ